MQIKPVPVFGLTGIRKLVPMESNTVCAVKRTNAAFKKGILEQNSKLRPSLNRMPSCGLLLDGIVLQCSPRPFEVRPLRCAY